MPQSRREYKSPGFTLSSPALHYILSGFTIFVSNIEKINVLDARNSWQGDTTKNSKSTSDLSFVSHISLICAFPVLITASFLLLHTFVNNFVTEHYITGYQQIQQIFSQIFNCKWKVRHHAHTKNRQCELPVTHSHVQGNSTDEKHNFCKNNFICTLFPHKCSYKEMQSYIRAIKRKKQSW